MQYINIFMKYIYIYENVCIEILPTRYQSKWYSGPCGYATLYGTLFSSEGKQTKEVTS